MVKAKPNQKIHVDKLAGALDKLDQLESKPVEELTLRESIYFLRGKLNSALKKGYSYEDLSSILAEQEILVSAATLKLYLTENSKSKNKKSTERRTQSKSSSKSTSVLSTNVTDSNPDVNRVYPDICKFAVFSEDERQAGKADRIFEMAMEQPVIVSLPSQVNRAVTAWIENNQLLEIGQEYDVSFCKWFVTNGEYDSIRLFQASVDHYGEQMTHVLVRNFGLCDEWSQVDNDKSLQKLIAKYGVKVIDFPKLGYQERYLINQKQLRFDDATKSKDLTVLGKQRVVNFLKAAYAAFDSTGVWSNDSEVTSASAS